MERTEDLLRIVEVYRTEQSQDHVVKRKAEIRPSQYLNLAQRVASNIDSNEALVQRMIKLSDRKEFSNDPTIEMTEISDLFHRKVAIIQREFESLKTMTEDRQQQVLNSLAAPLCHRKKIEDIVCFVCHILLFLSLTYHSSLRSFLPFDYVLID